MSSSHAAAGAGPLTMSEWAQRQAPHLDVISSSVPDPVLRDRNLVAVFESPERARDVVLAWERIEPSDGAVGTVVLGVAPDRASEIDRASGVDPEGLTGHALTRALQGGIPGAVVGAVVVAAIVLILDGWSSMVIGAALGGAAFGAVAGGFVAYVRGTGWGSAYEQSFVDAKATSVVFASIHSSEQERIDAALEAARDEGIETYCLDARGRVDPVTPGR